MHVALLAFYSYFPVVAIVYCFLWSWVHLLLSNSLYHWAFQRPVDILLGSFPFRKRWELKNITWIISCSIPRVQYSIDSGLLYQYVYKASLVSCTVNCFKLLLMSACEKLSALLILWWLSVHLYPISLTMLTLHPCMFCLHHWCIFMHFWKETSEHHFVEQLHSVNELAFYPKRIANAWKHLTFGISLEIPGEYLHVYGNSIFKLDSIEGTNFTH